MPTVPPSPQKRWSSWLAASLVAFCLLQTSASAQSQSNDAIARADYELVRGIGTKEAWDTFLRKHPAGFYADLARIELSRLGRGGGSMTAKPTIQALFAAAAHGDGALISALLDSGLSVDSRDEHGLSPTAYAAAHDNGDTMRVLLDRGGRAFDDDLESSPVVIAAAMGNHSVLPALLRHKIPPRHINEAYALAATRGDDPFVGALSKPLGIDGNSVAALKRNLEMRLSMTLLPQGQIDSLFVLAAMKYCKDHNISPDTLCLTTPAAAATHQPVETPAAPPAPAASKKQGCFMFNGEQFCP